MMTIEEKLKMYREKKNFVWHIANTFIKNPKGHTVVDITYEVWHKELEHYGHEFVEWVIVHFRGGAHSCRRVTGNSNVAIFQTLGNMVEGGYYEANGMYMRQAEIGYKMVDLTKLFLTEV